MHLKEIFKAKSKIYLWGILFIDYKDNLFLGDNVYIGHFNFIEASNGIEIGESVQNRQYNNYDTLKPQFYSFVWKTLQ